MLSAPVIITVSLLYLGLLFALAYWGDQRADQGRSIIANPTVYALSLAVYCTTWTFYGSIGRAAVSGIGFLPVYLGPTLVMALGWFVLLKMIRIAKTNRITSIADFISSRYGKSHLLGGLVTIIAVIGVIPYIALQLKAVSGSLNLVLHAPDLVMPRRSPSLPVLSDLSFYIALILAIFTIIFGTRHLDATERHEGMVAAIALESLVKLVAFLAAGIFITFGLYNGWGDIFRQAMADDALRGLMQALPPNSRSTYTSWFSITLLAGLSLLLLPRQFQIAVVENVNESHLIRAAWLFPLYLLLINLFVLPIALSGLLHFQGQGVDADTFLLTLPLAQNQPLLVLLVFIGGLSAATGLVIVETIALSTMICNDLVMPLLFRVRRLRLQESPDISRWLLSIRRGAIVLILLLGYVYFRLAGEAAALVDMGLISFAAVAQFAPALIGGMYWRGGTRHGAMVGLLAGFSVWAYTLLLPAFAKSGWLGWLGMDFIHQGFLGLSWLRPYALMGLEGLDEISHCLFWSFFANLGGYIGFSLLRSPTAAEASQATLFVDALKQDRVGHVLWRGHAEVKDLIGLVERFLGPTKTEAAFDRFARRHGLSNAQTLEADAELVQFVESLLAGVIGSASARTMVASVAKEEPLSPGEVMNILAEALQLRSYSRELERKSQELEAASNELKAANQRLQELDRVKDDIMSSVTHELRTPLTSIRALSEILRDDPEMPPTERERFLGLVVAESERLTRLINQMLDLAKIESASPDWKQSRVDLKEIIEQSVAASVQLCRDRQSCIEVDLPNYPVTIMADRDRLIQVVLNLLSNAVKFLPDENGKIRVTLLSENEGLKVCVADNGPGIRPEHQDLIFEKFRQVGDALTEKPAGTGLGLPISRRIIEHFGGRLWVESRFGEGACFCFFLPYQDKPEDKPNALPENE